MGANFSRVKTWVSTEDVTYSDLNAEFNNILDNLTAANVDDYSASVGQMQTTADPGEVGTESLATSVAGEISRLRFLINEITGEDEWYESPVASLLGLSNAIGTGLTNNRIVSGRVASGSAQPVFLVPNGAARTVKVDGSPTSFVYYVNGIEYSITSDTNLTGLTAAPSSNNTCLVDDSLLSGQDWTKYLGEDGTSLTVDNMGTEISSLVGKFAGFKVGAEYFLAFVESTTSLTKIKRGNFFDSTDAALPRVALTNNDTITLMKLTWVFAKTDLTLTATYNNPIWSDDEPSSPSTGDYWFDYSANTWKVYGVGSYSSAAATLIGICLQDATNTVAARSFEFFDSYSSANNIELIKSSASVVKSRFPGSQCNVWGSYINNDHNVHSWDMTLDLDSGVTEAAVTYYFFYLTETGDKIISNIRPHDRREDLGGYYHPHKSWRCVGSAFNNASSDLTAVTSYYKRYASSQIEAAQNATSRVELINRVIPLDGSSGAFAKHLPPVALWKDAEITFVRADNTFANPISINCAAGEFFIGGKTAMNICTQGESWTLASDGSNVVVRQHYIPSVWIDGGPAASNSVVGAVTTAPGSGASTNATIVTNKFWYRRNGPNLEGRHEYKQTTAGNSSAGSGDYLFRAVPTGLTIDTSRVSVFGGASEGTGAFRHYNTVGSAAGGDTATTAGSGNVVVYDASNVRLAVVSDLSVGFVGSGYFPFSDALTWFATEYSVPIVSWDA